MIYRVVKHALQDGSAELRHSALKSRYSFYVSGVRFTFVSITDSFDFTSVKVLEINDWKGKAALVYVLFVKIKLNYIKNAI